MTAGKRRWKSPPEGIKRKAAGCRERENGVPDQELLHKGESARGVNRSQMPRSREKEPAGDEWAVKQEEERLDAERSIRRDRATWLK